MRFEIFRFLSPAERVPEANTHQYAEQCDGNVDKASSSATRESHTISATRLHNLNDSYHRSQDEWQDDPPKKLRQDPFHVHKPTQSRL
jgi:hypothetical protein